MSDRNLIRIGGLWESVTKDGETYFSGKLTHTSRLLAFANHHKEGNNAPDFILSLAPIEQKAEGEEGKS